MKSKILLAMAVLALTACSKKPEAQIQEEAKQEAIANARVSVQAVADNIRTYYNVRILCIDGTQFVTHGEGITQHWGPDGKPTQCTVEK